MTTLGGTRVRVNPGVITSAINRARSRPMRPNTPGGIFNQTTPNTTGAASPNTPLGEFTRNNRRGG